MSSTESSFAQRHLWRIWLLVLLGLAVIAGIHALSVRFVQFYPGDISPDGSRLVAYEYVDTSQYFKIEAFVTDTKTGQVLQDLSDFKPIRPRWRWAPNGNNIVGAVETNDSAGSRVVRIDMSGPRQVLREGTYRVEHIAVQPDTSLVYIERHEGSHLWTGTGPEIASRPYLRFVAENDVEIARFEYGMDENAFVRAYPDDRSIVGVLFSSSGNPTKGGDYIVTDGPSTGPGTLVQFDSQTGQRLHTLKLSPRNDGRVFRTSQYAITSVGGSPALVNISDPSKVIRRMSPNDTPLLVNEEHVVTIDRFSLDVYSRSNPTVFPIRQLSGVYEAVADSTGDVICSTYNGRLLRFDPATGHATTLFDARRWSVQTAYSRSQSAWYSLSFGWHSLRGIPAFPPLPSAPL